jgi:hypothetical protein
MTVASSDATRGARRSGTSSPWLGNSQRLDVRCERKPEDYVGLVRPGRNVIPLGHLLDGFYGFNDPV